MSQMNSTTYDPHCEYCDGTVRGRIVRREVFRVRDEFVILEDIPVGVCDRCSARFYHAPIVRRAHEIARDRAQADSEELVPVGHLR